MARSEAAVVLLVLQLAHEEPLVDFTIEELVVEGSQAQVSVLSCACTLLLGSISEMGVLLCTLHHRVERTEVVGVDGELRIGVAAKIHSTSLISSDCQVVRDGLGHVLHPAV